MNNKKSITRDDYKNKIIRRESRFYSRNLIGIPYVFLTGAVDVAITQTSIPERR
jgi:hypothetical protein